MPPHKPPISIHHRSRRQPRRRSHHIRITRPRLPAHRNKSLRERRPKLLPPTRLRRQGREVPHPAKSASHHFLQARVRADQQHHHDRMPSQTAAAMQASITIFPGPVSNAITPSSPHPAGIAVKFAIPPRFSSTRFTFAERNMHTIQHRHQRSALPTRRQIRRPEVAHHRTPQPLRNHGCLAHLPRRPHRPPKYRRATAS